jgi:hypothetical protein
LIAGAAAPHHGHLLNPEGEGEGDGDQGAATTETAPPKKAHGRGGECTLSEHRTAVVIEDDVDVRNLLSAILKGAGFACFPERPGSKVSTPSVRIRPTLTTLDISLPGIGGLRGRRLDSPVLQHQRD